MRVLMVLPIVLMTLAGCLGNDDPIYEEFDPGTFEVKAGPRPPGWPELSEAKIRPGSQVFSDSGQCTGNFIFRTPDNATLFMGIAAHCFMDEDGYSLPMGSAASIGGVDNAGRLVWSLWEDGPDAIRDFALIELANTAGVRGEVHPAVMYFGGPTGMADAENIREGQYVVSYGHSGNRPDADPDNPREGFVVVHDGGEYQVYTDHPGIPGDSGSGLMTSKGLALGVLSRKLVLGAVEEQLGQENTPTVNYYVELDTLLDEARKVPGLENIEVVPFRTLEDPELPL